MTNVEDSKLQLNSDDGNTLDESEMQKHLMDVESSFLPPDPTFTNEQEAAKGFDDTYLELADPQTVAKQRALRQSEASDATRTAASPSAVAASRITHPAHQDNLELSESDTFGKPLIDIASNSSLLNSNVDNSLSSVGSTTTRRRPEFLANRQAGQRMSQTSIAAFSDLSDVTVGLDGSNARSIGSHEHTNLPTSRLSSTQDLAKMIGPENGTASSSKLGEGLLHKRLGIPAIPRVTSHQLDAPTETVLAARVESIQVPETVARDFRARNLFPSPAKRPASSDGPGSTFAEDRPRRTLTLKEQNGKIDKLTKENFDLKLKIHFLDQALRSHSEEGVQELIDKNVQFQTDLTNERKEMQTLRRRLREMERKSKEQDEQLRNMQQQLQQQAAGSNDTRSENDGVTLQSEMHEEILYLRQQLDHSENQVTVLREEMLTEKLEKRKLADHMRSMAGTRAEDNNGIRETMDMWQDLLNAETERREQAEEDLRKIREELIALKIERASPTMMRGEGRAVKRGGSRFTFTEDGRSDYANEANGTDSSGTLVDQLKHENAELRRDLGAQTSMLTSRNRERERLQQEIEDLKMLQRKSDGARSVAGDSIFDRSVSRAHNRGQSRASDHTSATDAERDEWERREGQLRDQAAGLKLKYQELERTHNTHLQYIAALEGDFAEIETELNEATEDLKALSAERDEALQSAEELQQEYDRLEQEALDEIDKLEKELQTTQAHRKKYQTRLEQTNDSYRGLQGELREITQTVMDFEDQKQTSLRTIETLERQVAEGEEEMARWEQKCKELGEKGKKLEITGESLLSEVTFLREEQESDKIKIGELEDALNAAQQTIQDEQEKLKELEDAIVDERQQRDVLENKSKEEVQKVLDGLNTENAKTKDEIRRLRRGLSSKEVESTSWKSKLDDLESAFRQALGLTDGTKQSMLDELDRLQSELEHTASSLDRAKMEHADKDRLLRHRDGLLESTSLESRRLSDLLEKERAARKHDLDQFEKATRGQATSLRQVQQYESRIMELESGSSQHKRKLAVLDQQYRDQLTERNILLLAIWNRLSTLCGAQWSQNHALINGELPSAEVIARSLPAFHKNVLGAIKTIEGVVGNFRTRIRSIEKELFKDYQILEHNLDMRIRRMDSIERAVIETQARMAEEAERVQQQTEMRPTTARTLSARSIRGTEETGKLRSEVKLLRAELKIHRQHPSAMAQQLIHQQNFQSSQHARHMSRDSSGFKPPSPARQIVASLLRTHSNSSATEPLASPDEEVSAGSGSRLQSIDLAPTQAQPSEQRWVQRLKEMERRLKAEREARLLDRQGARQRLEEGRLENEELKMMLERERLRRESRLTESDDHKTDQLEEAGPQTADSHDDEQRDS